MAKQDSGTDAAARLEAALVEGGFADPRPALRERLRVLRDTNPSAFEHAKTRYETVVREAATGDVLDPWIEYGTYLGQMTGEGRLFRIDETGRGAPYEPPLGVGAMVLHLPDDAGAPALAIAMPREPTAAQQATHDLLVGRKLAIG